VPASRVSRVQGSGFRVQGSGFRVQGSGLRFSSLELKVWGLGLDVAEAVEGSGSMLHG